jgi:hypothetical protein
MQYSTAQRSDELTRPVVMQYSTAQRSDELTRPVVTCITLTGQAAPAAFNSCVKGVCTSYATGTSDTANKEETKSDTRTLRNVREEQNEETQAIQTTHSGKSRTQQMSCSEASLYPSRCAEAWSNLRNEEHTRMKRHTVDGAQHNTETQKSKSRSHAKRRENGNVT